MNKDLFLFTSEFPYGNSETFIKSELDVLSKRCNKVYLVPNKKSLSSVSFPLPANVEVFELDTSKYSYSQKIKLLLVDAFFILNTLLNEILKSRQKKLAIKNLKHNFYLLASLILKKNMLKFRIKKENSIFYTYWFSSDATLMSILVKKRIINGYFSRAHGFDLYEYNGKENYISFRNFQLSFVSSVFCVSKMGENYLSNLYPQFKGKIKSSYLGVFENGINSLPSGNAIIVLTCSNIVPVKRLNLLVEALKSVKVSVKWVHFGSGYLRQEIENEIELLPKNINVELRGQVENETLINYYQNNPISVFVNTSISEGLPFSIMEAISFGVPVIATNVGGVSEIVTKQTGVLLDVDFQINQLATLLNDFQASDLNSLNFRKGVKNFHQENFSALKNYSDFSNDLFQL